MSKTPQRLIIPSAYLPSISYFAAIVEAAKNGREIVIDLGENYIKRTQRNRCKIVTAQGEMELTVPVQNANKPRQKITTITIDNSKRWQHQHWVAIRSAYKASPYFDHFEPYLEPIYTKEWSSLTELNDALMGVALKLLKLEAKITKSELYIECREEDIDLRPKNTASQKERTPKEYTQVFHYRLQFIPNASILDLILCEGPLAVEYL
ncbi:MAG: WbqC family protein [Rikenellaceae bacterium]